MRPPLVIALAAVLVLGGLVGVWTAWNHVDERVDVAVDGALGGEPVGQGDADAPPETMELQPYAPETAAPADDAADAAPAEPVPVGRVVGRVLLGREPLPPEPIDRRGDPNLADAAPIWDESTLAGPDTGLQGVFVWPVQAAGAPTTGDEPVELTLRDGRFVPRHVAVAPGQVVRIVNSDPTTYTLAAQPQVELSLSGKPNPAFEVELGPGESVERRFLEPEVAVPIVGRYPHDWVVGWVAIFDRPHASTDAFGRYEFELPAGEHDLKLWHETMDTREGHVRVVADDEADWSVTFLAGRSRRGGGR